jgi:hypothetical protein
LQELFLSGREIKRAAFITGILPIKRSIPVNVSMLSGEPKALIDGSIKTAINPIGCKMGWVIGHPESSHFGLDSPEIFRLVNQCSHPNVWVGGVKARDETPGVGQAHTRQQK